MSNCFGVNRASYNRINPNIRVGQKSPKTQPPKPAQNTVIRVFVRGSVRPVSTFNLTLEACRALSETVDTDLSPYQIHAQLLSGKPFKSVWNNQPALLKI